MPHRLAWLSVFLGVIASRAAGGEMPWVRVADDKHGFVLSSSAKPFVPWGFNYDHDKNGRLLEDYWDKEWPKVEADFRKMKQSNLERLGLLVVLAEKLGLYLDLTGLACYRKKDVPEWYDRLDEEQRW